MSGSRDQVAERWRPGAAAHSWEASVAPVALCVATAGLVALASLRSGGYFPADVLLIGLLALAASGVFVLFAGRVAVPPRPAVATLGALVALAGWSGVSASWSPDPAGAELAMLRDLAYAAVVLTAILAAGTGRYAVLLLRLVVVVLAGVCVLALLSRLQPLMIETDPGLLVFAQGRLSYPISYWNGLGAVAAMTLLACVALAADHTGGGLGRAAAAAAATVATVTLYLTLSRASIVAAGIGLAVVLALSPWRARIVVSVGIATGCAAIGILVLRSTPVLIDQPGAIADQSREGGRALMALGALALAAAGLQYVVARAESRRRRHPTRRAPGPQRLVAARSVTPVAWTAALAMVGLFVVGYGAVGDRLEGRAADGVVGARSFIDRQYDAFLDPVQAPSTGQERLQQVRSSRSDSFRVAREAFSGAPLVGVGAAGYRATWYQEREIDEAIRNAHSLELETLAELGLVGGVFLAVLLGALLTGLRALRVRTRGLTRSQAAAAGGVVVVWIVHSALDWDWQLAAVTLPALVCAVVLHSSLPRAPAA